MNAAIVSVVSELDGIFTVKVGCKMTASHEPMQTGCPITLESRRAGNIEKNENQEMLHLAFQLMDIEPVYDFTHRN